MAYIQLTMVHSFWDIICHFDGWFLFIRFLTMYVLELIILPSQESRKGKKDVI